MELQINLNLDKYWPSEIIAMHKQGLVSLAEIIASGRHINAFGDELANYVWQASKLDGDKTELNGGV